MGATQDQQRIRFLLVDASSLDRGAASKNEQRSAPKRMSFPAQCVLLLHRAHVVHMPKRVRELLVSLHAPHGRLGATVIPVAPPKPAPDGSQMSSPSSAPSLAFPKVIPRVRPQIRPLWREDISKLAALANLPSLL